jgi:hypothetical protein
MHRLAVMVYGRPTTLSPEVIVASTLLWWGVWVGNPLWDAASPFHSGLSTLAPESMLGATACILGLLHLTLLTRLNRRSDALLRRRRLVVAAEFAFFVLLSFAYVAQWRSTAMAVYPGLALLCAWIYLRMAVNE